MAVCDVMTTQLTTARAEATVQELAHQMLVRRVSGIPIVDDAGEIEGMVSEGDLMRRTEVGTDQRAHRSWWLRLFGDSADFSGDTVAELMNGIDGPFVEDGFLCACQFEVMGDILFALIKTETRHMISHGDSLIEGFHNGKFHGSSKIGLS